MYNEERLYEKPIPVITVTLNNDDDNINLVSSTVNDDTEEQPTVTGNENDPNAIDDTNVSTTVEENEIPLPSAEVFLETNENGITEVDQSDEFELDPIKMEPEFQLNEDERNRFDEMLNFSDEISNSDDDVSSTPHADDESDNDIVWNDGDEVGKFPMPMAATMYGLTKRENDPISLSVSFNEKVSKISSCLNNNCNEI